MNTPEKWTRIALANLAIVALLGLVMRYKMMFPLPFIDFKNILHAHTHFAFGGWITLALMALMVCHILPPELHARSVYQWLLRGVWGCAAGMLFSFLFQGYGFISILFSTLFLLISYAFTIVFIRDIRKTAVAPAVKTLSIAAVLYLSLSSIGPWTLAGLLATRSGNIVLQKDAVYTYLHLQYSGFFTLSVFALLFQRLQKEEKRTRLFAALLTASVIPSLFASYLWHYPNVVIRIVATAGSLLSLLCTVSFFIALKSGRQLALLPVSRKIGVLAMAAFVLKMLFQALTIVPALGALVFSNRPVVIGFLHLVLLGFVTLFLFAYLLQTGLVAYRGASRWGVLLFITGVLVNELVLFAQGLGFMLMRSGPLASQALLGAALCLFTGALFLTAGQWTARPYRRRQTAGATTNNLSHNHQYNQQWKKYLST